MAAIAMGESSGNPNAHNPVGRDDSYGLWQINMLGKMGPERRRLLGISSNEDLKDPKINAKAAYLIYKQQGLNAWTVYSKGTYRQFMGSAAAAVPTDTSGIGGGGGGGGGGDTAGAGGSIRPQSGPGAAAPASVSGSRGPVGGRLSGSESNALWNAGAYGPQGGAQKGFSPAVEAAAAQARIAGRGKFMNQGQFGPNLPPAYARSDYGYSDASYRAQDAAAASSEAMGAGGINYGGTDAGTLADAAVVGKVLKDKKDRAATASLADLSNPAGAYYDPAATAEQVSSERTDPAAMAWAENQRAKMDAERMQMGDAETVGGVPGFDAKSFRDSKIDYGGSDASYRAQDAAAAATAAADSASLATGAGGINYGGSSQLEYDAVAKAAAKSDPILQGGLNLQARSTEIEAMKMKQYQSQVNPAAQFGFEDKTSDSPRSSTNEVDSAVLPGAMMRNLFGNSAEDTL
jgi:hypothetical protein